GAAHGPATRVLQGRAEYSHRSGSVGHEDGPLRSHRDRSVQDLEGSDRARRVSSRQREPESLRDPRAGLRPDREESGHDQLRPLLPVLLRVGSWDMVDGPDGRGDGTELQAVARALADTVPLLVERLSRARPGRIYREALELLERPLLEHVLAMT